MSDFIDIDGLVTGPHMVRAYRERIADLEAMLRIAAQDAWGNVHFIDRPRDEMHPDYPDFFIEDLEARLRDAEE